MKFKIQSKIIDGEKWIKFDKNYDEKRYFYGNIIMLVFSVLTIIFVICGAYYTLNHINELTENPLVYGLSQLDVEVYCTCNALNGHYAGFWVNSTNIGVIRQYGSIDPRFLNFSPNMLDILKINESSIGNIGGNNE